MNSTTTTTATPPPSLPTTSAATSVASSTPSPKKNEDGAGSKRPLQRVSKNGEPLTEKKLRRLEKNRLSARECRRRKREATEDMQRQINLLEGENLRLRLQLQVGEEAEASSQQEQQRLTESLDSLLKSGASESEIYAKIEEYKEKFADYGRDRRSGIEFHLRNIERLLMPTQTTSIILTTLKMGNEASGKHEQVASNPATTVADSVTSAVPTTTATSAAVTPGIPSAAAATTTTTPGSDSKKAAPNLNAKSLFTLLTKTLDVTPEQSAALKDSRFVAKEMDECLKASLLVLKELRKRLTQCGEDLETEFNTVRSILTPTQAAKFLVWVANNKACMHMLNELWNKVYPPENGEDSGENSP